MRIDDFAAIQKQIGGLHRYVTLFESLVDVDVWLEFDIDSAN